MKKCILLLSIVLAICCLFTSCDDTSICTVTFKGIDGVAEQAVPKGRKATQPALSTQQENSNPGFAFVGWTLDGDDYDFTAPVNEDLVLVVKWGVKCTVVFNTGEDGSSVDPEIIDYYTKLSMPTNPTRPGYTFVQWMMTDENGTYPYNFTTGQPVYQTYFELVAQWSPNEISIKYDANGGTLGDGVDLTNKEPNKFYSGSSYCVLDVSSSDLYWTGKTFMGWSVNEDGSGTVYHPGEAVTVKPNNGEEGTVMTLYAVWEAKEYRLGEFGPSGGLIIYDCDEDNDKTYSSENGTTLTNKDGLKSEECGWRYIEAAPAPLAGTYRFGYRRDSMEGQCGTSAEIGKGLSNTKTIYKVFGNEAYWQIDASSETYVAKEGEEEKTESLDPKGIYAAKACLDHSVKNSSNMTYDDWYLPSQEEFYQLYAIYSSFRVGRAAFVTGRYVTSTENSTDNKYCVSAVAVVNEYVFRQYKAFNDSPRSDLYSVWPVRYF
jgi:uncharacterized repeat protein (TIGR02543 family)